MYFWVLFTFKASKSLHFLNKDSLTFRDWAGIIVFFPPSLMSSHTQTANNSLATTMSTWLCLQCIWPLRHQRSKHHIFHWNNRPPWHKTPGKYMSMNYTQVPALPYILGINGESNTSLAVILGLWVWVEYLCIFSVWPEKVWDVWSECKAVLQQVAGDVTTNDWLQVHPTCRCWVQMTRCGSARCQP